MYTEGFEGLEEAEKESHRAYGSSSETDRILRENEKLKKSLEKEKFFNKLLDQEIQELKSSIPNAQGNYPSEYWTGPKRVSRSAFYTLLVITLVMAAYIGYGIYYDKKFDYIDLRKHGAGLNGNDQAKTGITDINTSPAAVKDSVPNIIGTNKNVSTDKQSAKQKAALALTPDEEYDEDEVNATIQEETTRITRPARPASASTKTPSAASIQPSATISQPAATTNQGASTTPAESRTVIGKYRITSKANFYNAPDENTMRSTFISESSNKTVNALEDKNGFIFVEYTNDLGFTSKGWLSKKDLTKE